MQYLAQEPNSYKATATCISKCLASTVFSVEVVFVSLNHNIKTPSHSRNFVSISKPWIPVGQLSRTNLFSFREVYSWSRNRQWLICLHKPEKDAAFTSHLLFSKVSNIRWQLSWHSVRCVRKPNMPITHWGAMLSFLTSLLNGFCGFLWQDHWQNSQTSRCYGNIDRNWHSSSCNNVV